MIVNLGYLRNKGDRIPLCNVICSVTGMNNIDKWEYLLLENIP